MAIIPKKHEMPTQAPEVRAHNFSEVALGYTEETAVAEAERCLNCKNRPCVAGCPVNIHIPEFIQKVKARDYEGAYQVINQTSSLPAVCGRVCPQETQCEKVCVVGVKNEPIAIGQLERFLGDMPEVGTELPAAAPNGKKVAVIGAGPSGITCAAELARYGFDVTVFEAFFTGGGVPNFNPP